MKNIDLTKFMNKNVSEVVTYADKLYNSDLNGKIHAHKIYKRVLEIVPNSYEHTFARFRGLVRQKIWNCEKFFHWNEQYYSQSGQDKIVKNYFFRDLFKKTFKGFFVEIGAYDGVLGSNCLHFEKFYNWDGIAIEPSIIQYQKLINNRKCKTLNKAIDKFEREIEFIEVTEGLTQMSVIKHENFDKTLNVLKKDNKTKTQIHKIKTSTFDKILENNNEIDYLSIDTEGNEIDIIESIDFKKFKIKVISIENNTPETTNINNFLSNRDFVYFDKIGVDEIYFNRNFYKL